MEKNLICTLKLGKKCDGEPEQFFVTNCNLSVHQIMKVFIHPVLNINWKKKKSFHFEKHINLKEIYLFAYMGGCSDMKMYLYVY